MGTRNCKKISAMAAPSFGEAGKTGQWRTQRPVVDQSKCVAARSKAAACFQCWLYCPEAVIEKQAPIEINLEYCKGCGICAEECAAGAIMMVSETESETPAVDPLVGEEALREMIDPDGCDSLGP